jgi:RNA polymerase sigma-70 factor (ECF subfamily)
VRVSAERADEEFDVILVERVRGGDRAAFEALFRRHASIVLRYAWALAADAGAAEDLVQETFVTCWSKRRSLQVADESLLPWLLTVCKNHARNRARKRLRERTTSLDAEREIPAPVTDDLIWVRDALDELPADDRRVIELCLIEGYSYKQAAAALDATESAVGKRLQRARMRMREAVNEHDH